MIILIAESKTMLDHEQEISASEFASHTPSGELTADEVMETVAGMSVADLAAAAKLSPAMASRLLRAAYEFPNKRLGIKSIEAYTGVVFKELDYPSLTPFEKRKATEKIRIISSLYGYLKPDDIIKPYRFDYTTRLAPGDLPFAGYWRKQATIELVKEIKKTGDNQVLNLLPGDAAKAIDWKLVKAFCNVWKVDFKQLRDGGETVTPHAGLLKKCRGALIRAILTQDLTSPEELLTLATKSLLPLGTPDYPDHIAFCI